MERTLTTPKDPDDVFRTAVTEIGPKQLAPQMGVSLTHLYRMAADGRLNGESRNNTFTQLYKLGAEMVKVGMRKHLRNGLQPVVRKLLKCKMVPLDSVPDKQHYHEELVDLNCSISDLMETAKMFLKGDATRNQLEDAEHIAIKAVGEFTVKAIQEQRKSN